MAGRGRSKNHRRDRGRHTVTHAHAIRRHRCRLRSATLIPRAEAGRHARAAVPTLRRPQVDRSIHDRFVMRAGRRDPVADINWPRVKGRQRIADAITDPQCLKLLILDGDAVVGRLTDTLGEPAHCTRFGSRISAAATSVRRRHRLLCAARIRSTRGRAGQTAVTLREVPRCTGQWCSAAVAAPSVRAGSLTHPFRDHEWCSGPWRCECGCWWSRWLGSSGWPCSCS